MKGVYMFFADGFEETEALAAADVLKRGGVPVKMVSIGEDRYVTSAHFRRVPFRYRSRRDRKG